MSSREIWENILLIGKSITLHFESATALNNFKSTLQVYKSRANSLNTSIGLVALNVTDSICCDIISIAEDGSVKAKFYLAEKKLKLKTYSIVEIT